LKERDVERLRVDLEKFKEFKKDFLVKYGDYLSSVWPVSYNKLSLDETTTQSERSERYADDLREKHDIVDEDFLDRITIGAKSVRGKGAGLSRFPINICKNLIRFYSNPGDVILDFCSGHNSRMAVVFNEGRNYIGYDICKEFMDFNRKVADGLQSGQLSSLAENLCKIVLKEKSSTWLEESDESVDFAFTSPPYWFLEFYSDDHEQMGWNKTYEEFLQNISLMLNEGLRVLKVGKFCAINVADFKLDRRFYDYHCDLINIGKQLGFSVVDIIIMVYQRSIKQVFLKEIEETKSLPKNHEYIIVFRKDAKFEDRLFPKTKKCNVCGAISPTKKISDRQYDVVCPNGHSGMYSVDFSFIRQRCLTV
jgi:DNA modification methylase